MKSDNRLLISSLQLIDKTSSDGNAKLSSPHFVQPSLTNLLEEPELLDGFRSEMSYRATRMADEQLCYDTERRLVTWAIDWCRQTAEIADVHHTTDKVRMSQAIERGIKTLQADPPFDSHLKPWTLQIALLRACCSSLALLELGWHSSSQSDAHIPLCNNSFLPAHAVPPSNSWVKWKRNKWISVSERWETLLLFSFLFPRLCNIVCFNSLENLKKHRNRVSPGSSTGRPCSRWASGPNVSSNHFASKPRNLYCWKRWLYSVRVS